jgi:type I restriction enzyme S subunit
MDASAISFPRAFAVRFKDFLRWDIPFFRRVSWHWPRELISPLGRVIVRKQRPVDSARDLREIPIIEKITFGGRVLVSDVQKRVGYKGRLFWAEPGDLIYSKIRAKQGSLALVPGHLGELAVSSEYPVYDVDEQICDSSYLELVLQSASFRGMLGASSHGGSTKTRIPPVQFESLEIPLPPLQTQQAIVHHWRAMHDSVEANKQNAATRLARLDVHVLDALGLSVYEMPEAKKYLAVPWSQFRRWSVSYNEATLRLTSLSRGRYPVAELGSLLELVQYGTSEKANTKSDGTPILRMNNIIDGQLDLAHLKYIQLSERERMKLLLRDGDILFNRTNSKELVGKCAVFHSRGEYAFASYLIRLRVAADQASPDFIAYAINSSIGRLQIDALSRQIIGQANVNTDEIRSLLIPLPPLSIQREIVRRIDDDRLEIAGEKENAGELQSRVGKEVEEMILGIRPVTGFRK